MTAGDVIVFFCAAVLLAAGIAIALWAWVGLR